MARDTFESDVGGELRDRYGRIQYVITPKHTAPIPSDTTRGYTATDGDGRQQIVLLDSSGNDLAGSLATAGSVSQYVTPIGPRFMAKLKAGVLNATLLVLNDSTGADAIASIVGDSATTTTWLNKTFGSNPIHQDATNDGFVKRLAKWLAAVFPAYTVNYYTWNDAGFNGSWSAATVIQTGPGSPPVLKIYNGSVSGKTEQYPLGGQRQSSMVIATQPDLILAGFGHNDVASITIFNWRIKSLAHSVLHSAAQAELAMIIQNAESANTFQQQRADGVAIAAHQTGGGLLNFQQSLMDADPSWATTLLNVDGVHPNSSGVNIEVNVVASALLAGARYGGVGLQAAGGFQKLSPNILQNGDFSGYAGGATVGNWVLTRCTASQDFTNFENPRGYALKLTSDASSIAASMVQVINNPQAMVGKWVTLAGRVFVPSGQTDDLTVCNLRLGDNTQTFTTQVSINARDAFYWETISVQIAPGATSVTAGITVDTGNANASNMTVDRLILVVGDEPRDMVPSPGGSVDFPTGLTAEARGLWTVAGGNPTVVARRTGETGTLGRMYISSDGNLIWNTDGNNNVAAAQIGFLSPGFVKVTTGQLHAAQGFVRACNAANKTGAYTLLITDDVITVDTVGGAFQINLPSLSAVLVGKEYQIVDATGHCATTNLTLSRAGADTINGGTTIALATNWGKLVVLATVSGWVARSI